MKRTEIILAGIFTLIGLSLSAQGDVLQRKVSLDISEKPLGDALTNISMKYNIRFAYSSDIVPIREVVSVQVDNEPLNDALDEMLATTQVEYQLIGSHIILKVNKGKLSRLSKPLPQSVPQITPLYQDREPERTAQHQVPLKRQTFPKPQDIGTRDPKSLPGGDQVYDLDTDRFKIKEVKHDPSKSIFDQRLAQISLLSFVGTNAHRSEDMTNHLSVNIFWGKNGGVKGLEVGGFFNTVVNDVGGAQIAGLGNVVGGHVVGTQFGGLFNVVGGQMDGIQAGGLFNVSGERTRAIQVGGLFNVSSGDFYGLQVGGLFNVSNGIADAAQISGLFNTANGKVKAQVSSLFNTAGDVQWGQISSLLNVGRNVKGFQIGLINVSDTISGMPIGLLNIVKHGYNKVEFAGSETLFANFSLKLGARSFYNIFHAGIRWDDHEILENGTTRTGRFSTWGLGYGIGTAITMGRYTLVNFELESIHINELQSWTRELNQLNQARLTFDVRTGPRGISLFGGPVLNVMISRRYDPDTGLYGSNIAPHTFYDETNEGTNVKMWTGFTAGIRF